MACQRRSQWALDSDSRRHLTQPSRRHALAKKRVCIEAFFIPVFSFQNGQLLRLCVCARRLSSNRRWSAAPGSLNQPLYEAAGIPDERPVQNAHRD